MSRINRIATRYGQRRAVRKLFRATPWLGAVVAVVMVGETMRRKGVFRGAVDSALDALPFVGGAKLVTEVIRGRDFIPERQRG